MLKIFCAEEFMPEGSDLVAILCDVPDDNFDLETAVKEAALEYCRTPEGKAEFESNGNCFNLGDFKTSVPDYICKRHGFSIAPDMNCSYHEKLLDANATLVDEDDVE